MRVLLSSLGRELHEFISIDDPPPLLRLPIIRNKGYKNEEVVFVKIGTLDEVAIYIEDENYGKEKEWPIKSEDNKKHEPEL